MDNRQTAGKPLAALEGDFEPILARLAAGDSVAQLAKELGVSVQAVYQWLIAHCPDQWLAVSAARALARLEEAERNLEGANDNVAVSRARELVRLHQWTLERALRKFYGDTKTESAGLVVNVIIDRGCGEQVIVELPQ